MNALVSIGFMDFMINVNLKYNLKVKENII